MKLFSFIAAFLVAVSSTVNAAPANPAPKVYYQPDGTETPQIYLRGNQIYNWMADEKGFTVVKDDKGWYNYGQKNVEGVIVSSGIKVGTRNPRKAGIAKGLLHDHHRRPTSHLGGDSGAPSVTEHRSLLHVPESALCGFDATKDNPCRLKALVFLVHFSDHLQRKLPTREEYHILFNNNGPDNAIAPSGSVHDVFFENSYGTFVLESYVSPWLKVDRTEAQTVDDYYGLNRKGTKITWTEAITKFDKLNLIKMDEWDADGDQKFDCVVILHSGSAAESGGTDCESGKDMEGRIWSHATSSNLYTTPTGVSVNRFYVAAGVFETCPPGGKSAKWGIARVAVIAHEAAHFLGLPDLYDTEGGQGVGTFDLQGMLRICALCNHLHVGNPYIWSNLLSPLSRTSQVTCGDGTVINGFHHT
jgi:M6 family metalloprotease-like protein